MEARTEENRRLQNCINDLVSLLALPAVWSGGDPPQVAGALLDALLRMLRLDFAYVRLNVQADGSPVEALRVAERRKITPQPQQVGRALRSWLTPDTPTSTRVVPNPVGEGEITIARFWLGLEKEIGVFVAGSRRAGFPTETETLLLNVAVNQAVIELQQALARTERAQAQQALQHVHELLEQRVIERTGELAAVNEDLNKEIAERQHAEEALQKAFDEIKTLKDQLHAENIYLRQEIHTEQNWGEIVGESEALKKVLTLVEQVAPTTACALIQGETGTGKELIARAIHRLSDRNEQAFVKLNCAAIPTGLLEAELFGHEKGAFTGAVAQRTGRFELANRGTLFLDEVGEIPLELQVKLLRVLQEQEFERLGGTRTIRVDVRLVAASNRDLAQMVAEREFRSDLYYRLKVFPILVPPLRERAEDIPLLVQHFTERHARQCNKRITSIGKETMTALCCYPWPGNVREMENFIERSVILSQGSQLEAPLGELQAVNGNAADVTTLEGIEREHILSALQKSNWVIAGPAGAAAKLGLKRTSLQYKMQKLGIARPH